MWTPWHIQPLRNQNDYEPELNLYNGTNVSSSKKMNDRLTITFLTYVSCLKEKSSKILTYRYN